MQLALDRARMTRGKDRIALDRASVRTIDRDGHLRVSTSVVTEAQVDSYLGKEIVDYEKLGLDPNKVYEVFRPPEEIEKAAPSLQGKPVVIVHKPQVAEAHDKLITVGRVMNPEWKDPKLYAEIVVWDADAIKDIQTDKQSDISLGYWYEPVLESGAFAGKPYTIVMKNIAYNHLALVDEGRVKSAFVGDSNFHFINKEPDMKTVLSRKAVLAKGALAVYLRPKMAADAKLDFNAILKGVTAKNFGAQKSVISSRIEKAVAGKLAQDADISDVIELLDAMEGVDAGPDDKVKPVVDEDMTEAEDEGPDMEGLKAYLKDKLSPEDHAKACEMMGGAATDEEPDVKKPEPPKKAEAEKDMVSKPAMDAAIAAAVKAEQTRQTALREAEEAVRPYIGAVQGQDAASVYRMALDHAKVTHTGVTELPALKAMVKMIPLPGAKPQLKQAFDAAAAGSFATKYPEIAAVRVI